MSEKDGVWVNEQIKKLGEKKFEPMIHYYSFYDLFVQFVSGTPIKRKGWGGYWKYNEGNIYIFTKTGEVINFRNSEDILFTLSHLNQYDWEIATNKNCVIEVK